MRFDDYLLSSMNLNIELTKKTSNNYSLTKYIINAGTELSLCSSFSIEAKLNGHPHKLIKLQNDFVYYSLSKDFLTIMSNDPSLMYEYYPVFQKACGNCLIGGLGIGFIQKILLKCKSEIITHIDVIEKYTEVINLCGFENPKIRIFKDDIEHYIYSNDLSNYNFIFIDIGNGDEINYYEKFYMPIKKYLLENYPLIHSMFFREETAKFEYLMNLKRSGKI